MERWRRGTWSYAVIGTDCISWGSIKSQSMTMESTDGKQASRMFAGFVRTLKEPRLWPVLLLQLEVFPDAGEQPPVCIREVPQTPNGENRRRLELLLPQLLGAGGHTCIVVILEHAFSKIIQRLASVTGWLFKLFTQAATIRWYIFVSIESRLVPNRLNNSFCFTLIPCTNYFANDSSIIKVAVGITCGRNYGTIPGTVCNIGYSEQGNVM